VPPGALAELANSRAVTFRLRASHDIYDASSPRALAAFTTTERALSERLWRYTRLWPMLFPVMKKEGG